MLTRRGTGHAVAIGAEAAPARIVRLTTDPNRPKPFRQHEAFLSRDGAMPDGFGWYLVLGEGVAKWADSLSSSAAVMHLPNTFEYLGDGDVVRLGAEQGAISVLFQKAARHNSFLLTERCNHYCLMCSQPPRKVQDDWIVQDIMDAIPLIDRDAPEIGFTGGEPTLLGDRLCALIQQAKSYLLHTGLHILSNGRAFIDEAYVKRIADIGHPDLMFGIPIYSDLSQVHDYVVQADGAFDETIRGILNLKRHGLMVEIRVVIHKQTYKRLAELARFIARNLTFVDQVVLMGLEMTGFTRANLDALWIDPANYQAELVAATQTLANSRIKVSVYNHQLCITDRRIWNYARQSISDWKNEYMPECAGCAVQSRCAGFFSSAHFRYSDHIAPVTAAATA